MNTVTRCTEKGLSQKQNKLTGLKKKCQKWMLGLYASLCTAFAFAVPTSALTIKDDVSTEQVIGGFVDIVCQLARYVGIVIVVIGVVMFVLAQKDDNAESQSRAVRLAVVGAFLLSLKTVLKLTGLVA